MTAIGRLTEKHSLSSEVETGFENLFLLSLRFIGLTYNKSATCSSLFFI
jgi:hypothetical protein